MSTDVTYGGFEQVLGETFNDELLLYAWIRGFKIGEYVYETPPRRSKLRIGGSIKANTRIFIAAAKLLTLLLKNALLNAR